MQKKGGGGERKKFEQEPRSFEESLPSCFIFPLFPYLLSSRKSLLWSVYHWCSRGGGGGGGFPTAIGLAYHARQESHLGPRNGLLLAEVHTVTQAVPTRTNGLGSAVVAP